MGKEQKPFVRSLKYVTAEGNSMEMSNLPSLLAIKLILPHLNSEEKKELIAEIKKAKQK